jgi:hypothetical protein
MKPDRLKHSFLDRLRLKESWVIFFILGIIMLDYPFLHIFNKHILIFSLPLLFIYIFGGWCFSILVIYLFTKSIHTGSDNKDRNELD